jgi:hypothetical protein
MNHPFASGRSSNGRIVVTGAGGFIGGNLVAYFQRKGFTRIRAAEDAYPAMAERGYGWEKLISEMFCQEYWAERGLKTYISRFHNVYGCRKVIEALENQSGQITIWGDGSQTGASCSLTIASKALTASCTAMNLLLRPLTLVPASSFPLPIWLQKLSESQASVLKGGMIWGRHAESPDGIATMHSSAKSSGGSPGHRS